MKSLRMSREKCKNKNCVMKRFLILLLTIFAILPLVCFFLKPRLTDIDFLTLDLTVFSISLALMTFTAPSLMKFRDSLFKVDEAVLKKDLSIIDFCKTTIENFKKMDATTPQDSYKDIIRKAEERMAEYNDKIKDPFQFSDTITKYFKGTKDIVVWCLVAIVIHIVFDEVLLTSDAFSGFVKDNLSCMTIGWNLPVLKLIVSSYIKLVSLALQLYFLFMTSEDAISIILSFKSE